MIRTQHEAGFLAGLRIVAWRGTAPAGEVVSLAAAAMRAVESPLAIGLGHLSQSLSGTLSSVPMPKAMKRAMNNAPGIRATSQMAMSVAIGHSPPPMGLLTPPASATVGMRQPTGVEIMKTANERLNDLEARMLELDATLRIAGAAIIFPLQEAIDQMVDERIISAATRAAIWARVETQARLVSGGSKWIGSGMLSAIPRYIPAPGVQQMKVKREILRPTQAKGDGGRVDD